MRYQLSSYLFLFMLFMLTASTGCPKICPIHIWYVNDNLIYAHLHRLPHLHLKPIKKMYQIPRWVNDVSMHKLSYH